MNGQKEVLGMWIDGKEGAKYWWGVLNKIYQTPTKIEQLLRLWTACRETGTKCPSSLHCSMAESNNILLHAFRRGI